MASTGTLTVRVTTSRAELPVRGAIVVVAAPGEDGKKRLVSLMRTDESGLCPPLELAAPDNGGGREPGGPLPFSTYSLWAEHPSYEVAMVDGFQVFSGVNSVQNISLVPLMGTQWNQGGRGNVIYVEPQAL